MNKKIVVSVRCERVVYWDVDIEVTPEELETLKAADCTDVEKTSAAYSILDSKLDLFSASTKNEEYSDFEIEEY